MLATLKLAKRPVHTGSKQQQQTTHNQKTSKQTTTVKNVHVPNSGYGCKGVSLTL